MAWIAPLLHATFPAYFIHPDLPSEYLVESMYYESVLYIIVIVKQPNRMHLLSPNPDDSVLFEMPTFLNTEKFNRNMISVISNVCSWYAGK